MVPTMELWDSKTKMSHNNKCAFPTGLGGCNVFRWEGRGHATWMRVDTRLELPPDTLVYAELVTEHRGEHKAQRKLTTLHLIDGLILNGKDIRTLHIVERRGN
ncbi:Cap-specific mRNA (nucleoside-2'-O-)-methyltransferase 1 [Portunus trituberculatus]|uniref:Cap-specific mRNA (Nucleoside-2'-O-)-methyltransferase 1 n=1 Tax=Portunus trituberculatus TaxID=210409 RepID=A0A5B7JPI6_PORTR|nr:Cap-specific mRNA (nucleoside-2'-O-)-methyltransferase 1 [Portunus trituberculatus]